MRSSLVGAEKRTGDRNEKSPGGSPKEMGRKRTRAEGDRRRISRLREIELLMRNNCSEGGKQSRVRRENSSEHKEGEREVLFPAAPGCSRVPSASRLGWGLLLPGLCPIC